MSALAEQATLAVMKLVGDMQRLHEDVRQAKACCVDPAARDVLTRLQAELFGIKADAQGIKALISAARQVGYFDDEPEPVSAPYSDRRSAAAHDDTLFVTREEEERP